MTDISIEGLKTRKRALEIDVALAQGAVDEITHLITEMERRRGGRPRKSDSDKKLLQLCPDGVIRPVEMPQRDEGGTTETETEESVA